MEICTVISIQHKYIKINDTVWCHIVFRYRLNYGFNVQALSTQTAAVWVESPFELLSLLFNHNPVRLTLVVETSKALTKAADAFDAERMVSVRPRRNILREALSYVGQQCWYSLEEKQMLLTATCTLKTRRSIFKSKAEEIRSKKLKTAHNT